MSIDYKSYKNYMCIIFTLNISLHYEHFQSLECSDFGSITIYNIMPYHIWTIVDTYSRVFMRTRFRE